jgi:nitroreductase
MLAPTKVPRYNVEDANASFQHLWVNSCRSSVLRHFQPSFWTKRRPPLPMPRPSNGRPEMARTADYPIASQFLERWSPRAFADELLSENALMSMLEAARWAPSSYNVQPWRFIYGLRGEPAFDTLLDLLVPGNQAWAAKAAALVFIASKRTMRPRGAEADAPSYSHSFDAGAAWGSMALQAHLDGWATHGMTGVDFPRAAEVLGVPEDFRLEAAIAIGRPGDKAILPPHFQAMEQPNDRMPLSAMTFKGRFAG